MNLIKTVIPDALMIEPKVLGDDFGFFFESCNDCYFEIKTGVKPRFVQDHHSRPVKNILCRLHHQIKQLGKLVRVTAGQVFDIVVDIRCNSPVFWKHAATPLPADNKRLLWMPLGFAHGFIVTSKHTEFLYKTTDYWTPDHERCIALNNPELNIPWPLETESAWSAKWRQGLSFRKTGVFP